MPAPLRLERDLSPVEQLRFIEDITAGRKLQDICAQTGITLHQYYDFLDRYPEFEKLIELARVRQAHLFVDELNHCTEGATTLTEVQRAKVWSDNAKWIASKMVPTKYGENLNVNISHHLDLSSVLLAAEGRVLPLMVAKGSQISANSKKSTLGDDPQSTIIDVDVVTAAVNQTHTIDKNDLSGLGLSEGFTDGLEALI